MSKPPSISVLPFFLLVSKSYTITTLTPSSLLNPVAKNRYSPTYFGEQTSRLLRTSTAFRFRLSEPRCCERRATKLVLWHLRFWLPFLFFLHEISFLRFLGCVHYLQ
ncbi:hypothetical protein F5Y11DRAFT_175789 [Daldinia sp. FL1419]|nr:hypothetical protein F5Y11DRAFT_175789 [Daldinia sp. FL1419]